MTIGGALSDLNNLLKADDIPIYYKPSIKAIMDTIALEGLSEHKYNDAYSKGFEAGKKQAFTGYCMQCYDELSPYEQAKLMVEWGADIPNVLDKIRAEISKSKTEHEMQLAKNDIKGKLLVSHIYCDIVSIFDKCKAEKE